MKAKIGTTKLRAMKPEGGPLAEKLFEEIDGLKWGQAVAIENLFRGYDALEAALESARPKVTKATPQSKGDKQ